MTGGSRFYSRPTARQIVLKFEKIGDTYWTDARTLRAFTAELDRLDATDVTSARLVQRPELHELEPTGMVLVAWVSK